MLDFFNYIIKGAVVIATSVFIAVSGFFAHKPAQQVAIIPPPVEIQASPSSTQETTTSTIGQNAFVPQLPVSRPATDIKPKPKPAPAPVPVVVATTTPATEASQLPPIIQIDPETFVGILCYYNISAVNPANGSVIAKSNTLVRGSGVLVNSRGYILTNRHVVYPEDYTAAVGSVANASVKYQLDHCDVGQLPKGTHLPTPAEITSINPLVRIPVLAYKAAPMFNSSSLPLSSVEAEYADFAILKITGLSADGPSFGFTSVPSSFPYAKLIPVNNYDVIGQAVVTYGFPGDVTAGMQEAFQTLTMTGSVGSISQVEVGDLYYGNIPLVILTNLEISGGRSGSPLFWRGYIIGLTTFYVTGNRTQSGSVASDAIIKGLQATGYLQQ